MARRRRQPAVPRGPLCQVPTAGIASVVQGRNGAIGAGQAGCRRKPVSPADCKRHDDAPSVTAPCVSDRAVAESSIDQAASGLCPKRARHGPGAA